MAFLSKNVTFEFGKNIHHEQTQPSRIAVEIYHYSIILVIWNKKQQGLCRYFCYKLEPSITISKSILGIKSI